MIYLHVCLSRSRLCHALCPPLACARQFLRPLACVVAFVPLVDCLDVTICETHLYGVSVLDSHLSLLCMMFICLTCLLCATHMAFFASLHLCTLAYMFMHKSVSSILQSHGIMDTWSKPTFVLLGHPLLFDNMLVWSYLAYFATLSLSMLSFYLLLCLSTGFFLLSLYGHLE